MDCGVYIFDTFYGDMLGYIYIYKCIEEYMVWDGKGRPP